MPCYSPLSGWRCQDGSFTQNRRLGISPLTVPCGQCVGCRLERSRQWAIRCSHEASLYERNCFLTLTYSDEHLREDRSLYYPDFQNFMKRLRFSFKGHRQLADGTRPIRFYMCGEYGENFGRPHFHACIFNFDFDDKRLWKKTSAGSLIYRSASLEDLWGYGFSSIGALTFQSSAYVARYIMKKITGRQAASHYDWFDPVTGEVFSRVPEFNKMSLKPGIGAGWFDKFKDDVYPHDYVVINGHRSKPPRFYDKRFEKFSPNEFTDIKSLRISSAKKLLDDNTPERLRVKEQVVLAKLSRLKRKLI